MNPRMAALASEPGALLIGSVAMVETRWLERVS